MLEQKEKKEKTLPPVFIITLIESSFLARKLLLLR